MSDENQNPEPKKSLKSSAKDFSKKAGSMAMAPIRGALTLLSKTIKMLIWNPITIGALMFLIGARVHETGLLAGKIPGKDLRGATVRLSGSCKVNGKVRNPALALDQVIITYNDAERIEGVVRKTREVVDCERPLVAIHTLEIQDLLGKDNQVIPDLALPVAVEQKTPEYKSLEKKTLIMSGSCVDMEGKTLQPFTDEKVDVTSVIGDKDNAEVFTLTGILKINDKIPQTIRCLSTAIKYSEYNTVAAKSVEGMDMNRDLGQGQQKSYVGEMLVITGTCFPDERTKVNKTKKYLFYKLANSKVQVLEHDLAKDGTINRLVGTALDEQFRGDAIYCDKQKFPFVYKEFDEDTIKLEKGSTAETEADLNLKAPTPAPVAPSVENQ